MQWQRHCFKVLNWRKNYENECQVWYHLTLFLPKQTATKVGETATRVGYAKHIKNFAEKITKTNN